MAADDYNAAVSGGLKLKGVSTSSKISKHRKKKSKDPENGSSENATQTASKKDEDGSLPKTSQNEEADTAVSRKVGETEDVVGVDREDDTPAQDIGKTAAELRHEERRRKRLNERLKREGTKTHKERVEELNRYLSNLSEHHDMPRIGPG